MSSIKEEMKQYLPRIEELLTSILLEETHIEVVDSHPVAHDAVMQEMKENDIFLFTRDEAHNTDVMVILDPEWFGLLSSIMLGIEEKERNETTIELLEEFSSDLSSVVLEKIKENEIETDLQEIRVLSREDAEEALAHAEYVHSKMEVEGLADNKVRAEFLLGNPGAPLEPEEPESDGTEQEETDVEKEVENEFAGIGGVDEKGSREEVVSARTIEFAEFAEGMEPEANGEPNSMDLLKDVEIDVSVELGRIELPLGKVLQLAKGSVIELEKLAGEPVDILVNGHRIAHGEVVVIDEHFGVRISNLITTRKRLAGLSNGS